MDTGKGWSSYLGCVPKARLVASLLCKQLGTQHPEKQQLVQIVLWVGTLGVLARDGPPGLTLLGWREPCCLLRRSPGSLLQQFGVYLSGYPSCAQQRKQEVPEVNIS